jgi:transposase InsO family protein
MLQRSRLQREFTVDAPDIAWVTDITYIRTWQGWLYLSVVVDLFSRKVVGWSMKPSLSREVALDALLMAVTRRRPTEKVIVHSDQGTQFGSDDWMRFCTDNGLVPSMSRDAGETCWANAPCGESIVGIRKKHPTWGATKIREILAREYSVIKAPAPSTIHAVLDRNGLITRRKRRRHKAEGTPLNHVTEPNALWCADYKGEFMLGNKRYCYPLTITDYHSRYLLACEGLDSTKAALALPVFERVFREFGLPLAIRTDNGAPFASPECTRKDMVPVRGFEPPTHALRMRCSAS